MKIRLNNCHVEGGVIGYFFEGYNDIVGENLVATGCTGPGFHIGSSNPKLKRLLFTLEDSISKNSYFPHKLIIGSLLSELNKEADQEKSRKVVLGRGFEFIGRQANAISDLATKVIIEECWQYFREMRP